MQNYLVCKSEWQLLTESPNKQLYSHLHSQDLCQTRLLPALTIKQIDQYTSRELYCYPYCPRLYKAAMGRARYRSAEVLFDLGIVVETVPFRLGDSEFNVDPAKITDIVRGFSYLGKRYGPFRPTQRMVGCTREGLVKVWLNEDYTRNEIQQKLGEKEMTQAVVDLLRKYGMFDKTRLSTYQNLQELLEAMKKKSRSKQVYFQDQRFERAEAAGSQAVSREFKTCENFQSGKKERRVKKCYTSRRQASNCNSRDSSIGQVMLVPKSKTISWKGAQNNRIYQKTALCFTKLFKEDIVQTPKSQTRNRILPKNNENTNIDLKYEPLHRNFVINNFQGILQRPFTAENLSNKHSPLSSSLKKDLSLAELHNLYSCTASYPSLSQRRPKRAIIDKNRQTCQQPQAVVLTAKKPVSSPQAAKSIQQMLKQDIDALFISNNLLPQAVDKKQLEQELQSILQML